MVMELFCILTVSRSIFYMYNVILGRNWVQRQNFLYYFLEVHVTLLLPQNKKLIKNKDN